MCNREEPLQCQSTVLCEFGGAEYGGHPEGFFGASLEGQVGRQVGAAVEVLLTAGQAEVQALVAEGGVFITLKVGDKRKGNYNFFHFFLFKDVSCLFYLVHCALSPHTCSLLTPHFPAINLS